jgi:predicted porin
LAAINGILSGLQINAFDIDQTRGLVGPSDGKIVHFGATWRVGPGTLHGAVNFAKDQARSVWATEDAKVRHYALAYFYELSLRTQVYGAYALIQNSGSARVTPGAAGYAGGWATATGANTSAAQIGLRHTF